MRRTSPLILLVAACFDPTEPQGDDEGSEVGSETMGTSAADTTTASTSTASSTASTTAATTSGVDDTTTADATTTADDTSVGETGTTGGEAPICDQVTTLGACATAFDGVPVYGSLTCDASVTDFSVFFEDVYTVELLTGQCLYARVDNVGEAGMQGGVWADVALQLRSPSGAVAWQDDDVPCTDATWTGGACPQALYTADVDGVYELSVVQASGAGCTDGAPYSLFTAIDGAEWAPGLALDDLRSDCTL
jgi:hypothetical protein